MKSFIASALVATAVAAPLAVRDDSSNIDPTVLQFALTLEHLENYFYKQALSNYTQADFTAAGFPSDYYSKLQYISYDEQSHVTLLSSALTAAGVTPVQPCSYSFPATDAKSFVTLSSIIEGVGTSAYLGGAPLITSKTYLTVAGSILVTEAIHTSYQRNVIGEIPFANPYGTPLDPTSVYSIAAAFITSCPSGSSLPFTAFPGLTYDSSKNSKRDWESQESQEPCPETSNLPAAGSKITLTAAGSLPSGSYVTFVSGLSIVSVQGSVNGNSVTVTIPDGISGQSYVFITKSDVEGTFDDSAVAYGPAIVEVAPPSPN